MLRFVREDVVWQEVPHEVSLAYTIAGCPLRCPGCHSADTWNARQGRALSPAYLQQRLHDYAGLLSCVLFSAANGRRLHSWNVCARRGRRG